MTARKRVAGGVDYGNWVSTKLLYVPGAVTIFFVCLSFFLHFFAIAALIVFLPFAYFTYAYYAFSPRGKDVQAKFRALVLDNLRWDGKGQALDVGCGNAPLTIGVAKRHADARVVGIDTWGSFWDYSEEVCRSNAEAEGVAGRVSFQKASAAVLPFEDESFDAVVSNLAFHEVRTADDKREVVREALRVLKKGGKFCFQDLFLSRKLYGELDDFLETIQGWGIDKVEFVNTASSEFIPRVLKIPFMVGSVGIICGTK